MKLWLDVLSLFCIACIAGMQGFLFSRFLRNERAMRKADEELVARLNAEQARMQSFLAAQAAARAMQRRTAEPKA